PNAYGDAPADAATTIAPFGPLAIDTPRSPSNGSPPPQTAAPCPLPLASTFQTNASAADGSVRTEPGMWRLPPAGTPPASGDPKPGPPTRSHTKLPPESKRAATRFGSKPV